MFCSAVVIQFAVLDQGAKSGSGKKGRQFVCTPCNKYVASFSFLESSIFSLVLSEEDGGAKYCFNVCLHRTFNDEHGLSQHKSAKHK
jgi:hypothetical protein